MTSYRYGRFTRDDACALGGSVATITTHEDVETEVPGEMFGPHYVLYVPGKPYLMLLLADHADGDAVCPVQVVYMVDIAVVDVHPTTRI